MTDSQHIELGFPASATTGWGLIGIHLALGLTREGYTVHLPETSDLRAVTPPLIPTLAAMMTPVPAGTHAIRLDAYGNHWPAFQPIPDRTRVVFAVCEDTAVPRRAVDALHAYDLVLTPSRWAHDILAAKDVPSTLWHQGYDESVFHPAPRRRPNGPVYVFSGGKLEFRKGQDIVVEAFRRFRATPAGKDAVLVTAWQNLWPQTMEGIWASGYVKGIPRVIPGPKGPQLDIVGWLDANGLPRGSVIDLGLVSQVDLASAIRECDVALFPNRCEAATNMVLPEVLACGIPAIVSANTGHRDVAGVSGRFTSSPVTLPCTLYEGMEGWGESNPEDCATALQSLPSLRAAADLAWMTTHLNFGWGARCSDLAGLLAEVCAHA